MSPRPAPPRQLWWLVLGFGIWAIALCALYALHSFGCAFAWPSGALRLALVLVLLAYLGVLGWLWRSFASASPEPAFGPTGTFMYAVGLWTLAAAIAATVVTLGPPLLLSTCM
jgi:hypothetical protein